MVQNDIGVKVDKRMEATGSTGKEDDMKEEGKDCRSCTDENKDTVHMKRQIGLIEAISIIVSSMIGIGIFISPGGVLKKTDSVATSLVIWAVCGILSMLTALSFVELGILVPRSGAEHAYLMEAYRPLHPFWGEVPAFLYAWMTMLFVRPAALVISSLSCGRYILQPLIKALGIDSNWKTGEEYDWTVKLLALVVIGFMGFVNIVSAKLATKLIVFFTSAKITAMIVLISIGIYNVSNGQYGGIPMEYDVGKGSYGDIALAIYSGLYAYDGWNNVNALMEELENPRRNLPLAISLGMGTVTVLYMLINIAYLSVLDKESLIASPAVAVDVADSVLGRLKFIVPLLVAASTVGSANGNLFATARTGYVMSREGHFPEIISYVHATMLTPTTCVIYMVTISSVMLLCSASVTPLIGYFQFVKWIFRSMTLASLLIMRYTKRDVPRKFKVPIAIPILTLLVGVFLVVAPLVNRPTIAYLYVLLFGAVGVLFYYVFVFKNVQLPCTVTLTRKIQCLTVVAPSPYREDAETKKLKYSKNS